MVGKTDGRQLRWDSHNQARRQHILDAAIGVLADADRASRCTCSRSPTAPG